MNKNLKAGIMIVSILLFLAFLIAGYIGYVNLSKTYEENANINESVSNDSNHYQAPDILVTDKDGNVYTLDDFKGKPIVLNFWASWCPPCQSEMPNFDEVFAENQDDIQFLMVSLVDGNKETQATATQFVEDKGYSFPIFFDKNSTSAINYSVSSIPTSIFIDKDGYVVDTHTGALSKSMLEAKIEEIR